MSAKHVNAVIVPSSRCAALPSLRRKDGGADIRVALLEAGFQEGDLVSIGMETIPPDEQLEQARAAAKANGEEVTRLTLENARLAEKLKHAGDFTCGPDRARLEAENTRHEQRWNKLAKLLEVAERNLRYSENGRLTSALSRSALRHEARDLLSKALALAVQGQDAASDNAPNCKPVKP